MSEPYLTQYGLMAERHWRKLLPKMVRKLEAEGKLMETLFEAQETTIEEMDTLYRQLMKTPGTTPQQAQDQAWEMVREKYILLQAEDGQSL